MPDSMRGLRPAHLSRILRARRASPRELDRLLATQNAIATAEFDLDSVLETVVAEARRLTDADAAVVELPDGDELVYRAVAGTAAPYLGFRLARRTAISGLAMQTGRVLVCEDSETDTRVDREACRRVGARSMIVVPLMHDGTPTGVLKVYSDVESAFEPRHAQFLGLLANMIGTALVRADLMRKLAERAVTDELTGLPNRRAWYAQLELAFARGRRSEEPVSVVVLDLDDFKQVNDRDGHAAGDRLLRTVAAHWRAVVRESDYLGRLGGDEFAVVLERSDEEVATAVVARLADALPPEQRASAGTATWDRHETPDALVARADEAMYERKRASAGVTRRH